MAIVWSPPDGEYILGAGRIFLRPWDDANCPKGQRFYAAETANLTLNIASEEVVLQSVDSAVAQVLERVRTSITRSGRTTFRQIANRTLALFFAATEDEFDEAGEVGIVETHDITVRGQQIQLGLIDDGGPAWGYQNVTITAAARTSDSTALVAGTDYELDAERGHVRILETSPVLAAAAPGAAVEISITYTVAAYSQEYLTTSGSEAASKIYEMWFQADNTRGPNIDYWFPKVDLGPDGDLALKSRTEFQAIPVSFMVLEPGTVDGVDLEAAYILRQSVAA